MNGYDAHSQAALASHLEAAPRPEPATAPQRKPRPSLNPVSEVSSSNLPPWLRDKAEKGEEDEKKGAKGKAAKKQS